MTLPHSDVVRAVVIAQRAVVTEDGVSYQYECSDAPGRPIWTSPDIDEILAYVRGILTGQDEKES